MTITSGYGRLFEIITSHKYYLVSLTAIFFLILLGYFIAWPIVMSDTDLWYHLSGGRYFWQNGVIAHDAFFSYITPLKSWYNYYWLFQAIIYKIFQWSDYYGLIVLRCLIFFLTALFICLSFVRQRENRTELLLCLFLFTSCTILIMYRELLVRPHLFSYLFIVIFLYILEFRPDKMWLLPLLGIFWSNVHGIEFPVMFLIVFAYLAEIYWRQYRKTPAGDKAGKKEKWLLISVFYTIFFTPGIIELVQTPFGVSFQSSAFQHLYVAELLPIPFQNFFVFAPVTIQGAISSLQNFIVFLVAASFLTSLWKKKLRISHAVLLIGAILLVAKHARFTCEFTLLSIPLLYQGVCLFAKKDWLPSRIIVMALPVVLIIFPLAVFDGVLGNRPAYPFSQSHLPSGVVRFLNQHTPGGKILNEPNTGGYLPWALNKNFKIYMDMQMSLFSDTDFAIVQNAFSNANVFKSFIEKYDPAFITVSLNRPQFKKVVASDSRFVPVFFDHAECMYLNKDQYGGLARKYELKAIDPYHYQEINFEELGEDALLPIFVEAERIWKEDSTNYSANYLLGSFAIVRKQYNQALSHAALILRYYPELAHGYALKGDALFGMERYDEAARFYQKALYMGQNDLQKNVYWNLHAAYAKLKEYKKAYKVLSKYVNPFNPNADYKEIYQLGISAATVGKTREAVTFLKIAKIKVPPTDMEYVQKIDKNLAIQSGDEK